MWTSVQDGAFDAPVDIRVDLVVGDADEPPQGLDRSSVLQNHFRYNVSFFPSAPPLASAD
jgi:hypothetical protein